MRRGAEIGWIAADEADLSRRLEDVAETTEVDDEAWAKIQERITAATSRATPSRRPVALAAAAAVIALVMCVLTIVQREDPSVVDAVDEDSTTTTTDRRRSTTTDEDGATTTTVEPGSDGPGDVLTPPGSDPGSGTGTGSPTVPGTGGGGSDPGDDPGSGPQPPGPTTPTTTSTTAPPAPSEFAMSVSPSTITQGEGVTISSITPCVDDVWNEVVSVSVIHQGVQVGWQLLAPNGAGAWSWTFQTSTNNPAGTYTVQAQCAYMDPDNPDNRTSWDYDSMTFSLLEV